MKERRKIITSENRLICTMASNRLLMLCVLACTVMPATVFAKTYTTASPAVLYRQYLDTLGTELGSTLSPRKVNPVPLTTFEEALKAGISLLRRPVSKASLRYRSDVAK